MPIVEPDQIVEARELLRHWKQPFMLLTAEATAEDYEAIDDEDFKCEYLDGVLIMHSPASLDHEQLVMFLGSPLHDCVSRRRLGTVYGSNAVMQLGQRRFSPDVSYLSTAGEVRVRGGRVHGPMDLVIEVLSGSTRSYDRGDKLAAYQAGRVPEIWYVDSDQHCFEAYVLRGDGYERIELDAGRWTSTILPDVSLDVSWLWRRPLPSLDECRLGGRA